MNVNLLSHNFIIITSSASLKSVLDLNIPYFLRDPVDLHNTNCLLRNKKPMGPSCYRQTQGSGVAWSLVEHYRILYKTFTSLVV